MTPEEKKEARRLAIKKYNDKNKEKQRLYYQENKDKIKQRNEKNKEKKSEYNQKYYNDNKEKEKNRVKEYREANPDKIKEYRKTSKVKRNAWEKNKRNTDDLFKLKQNIRSLIRTTFKRNNFKKPSITETILNCSFEDFKRHLESKFEPWMNWNNYGLYNGKPNFGWDIDHIIPLVKAKTVEDIVKLNHYTNLQPLCSYVNRNVKKDN